MAQGNVVSIVGNITRDPELRFTPSGQAVCGFGVAVNSKWTDKVTQQPKENTDFFEVTAWRQLAENAAESLQKGTRVVVVGKLQLQSWETDSGDKRSKVQIIADEVSPSLVFATATIHRTERQSPSDEF